MIAALFLEQRHVAEGPSRGVSRFFARHPARVELLYEELEVQRELATELLVGRLLVKHGPKALSRDPVQAGECHARSSNKPTADESRFQDSSSRSS